MLKTGVYFFKDKILLLHTYNLEENSYATDSYFATNTYLLEEVLYAILEKNSFYHNRLSMV